ncbi:hypothetical protein ACTQ6A_04370 [Lachnospiraceae bacterium LCP25S3_G4]
MSVLLCGIMAAAILPKEEKNANAILKVGIGEDISGKVIEKVVEKAQQDYQTVEINEAIESYKFQDC